MLFTAPRVKTPTTSNQLERQLRPLHYRSSRNLRVVSNCLRDRISLRDSSDRYTTEAVETYAVVNNLEGQFRPLHYRSSRNLRRRQQLPQRPNQLERQFRPLHYRSSRNLRRSQQLPQRPNWFRHLNYSRGRNLRFIVLAELHLTLRWIRPEDQKSLQSVRTVTLQMQSKIIQSRKTAPTTNPIWETFANVTLIQKLVSFCSQRQQMW